MNQPLFSVNEEVILQSKSAPHLNGECVVLEILSNEDICIKNGFPLDIIPILKAVGLIQGEYSYLLTIPTGNGSYWAECAIRKKQKPADESFKSMMTKLNRIPAHA